MRIKGLEEISITGCSFRLMLIIFMITTLIWSAYQTVQLLSTPANIEYIPSSSEAAQKCREKFIAFKTNKYIHRVTLTETEVNSAIQEDLQKGVQNLAKSWIKFKKDKFILGGYWNLVSLMKKENEVSSLEIKSKENDLWHFEVSIEITARLLVNKGELTIIPEQIFLGKIDLPHFIIDALQRHRPNLFKYYVLSQIETVNIQDGAIELLKS